MTSFEEQCQVWSGWLGSLAYLTMTIKYTQLLCNWYEKICNTKGCQKVLHKHLQPLYVTISSQVLLTGDAVDLQCQMHSWHLFLIVAGEPEWTAKVTSYYASSLLWTSVAELRLVYNKEPNVQGPGMMYCKYLRGIWKQRWSTAQQKLTRQARGRGQLRNNKLKCSLAAVLSREFNEHLMVVYVTPTVPCKQKIVSVSSSWLA